MNNNTIGRQQNFPGRLGTLLCMWFLAGMLLSMLLSSISWLVGVPLPAVFFFLSGMVYLTGGLLGGLWSRESLRRKGLSYPDVIVALFVLIISIGFLLLSVVFAVKGFQRL
jgi:hypothetical protein